MGMPSENATNRTRQPQPSPGVAPTSTSPATGAVSTPSPTPKLSNAMPKPGSHSDDPYSSHSFAGIAMVLGGLLVAFLVAGFLIWFILSHATQKKDTHVTLEYWGLWEDSNIMQTAINDFERKYPTITVHYIKQDPKQYTDRLLTRIQQGNGPDIFRYHSSWTPMLLSVLSPLTQDVISSADFTKNYYPVMRQDLVRNGAIYGIPLEIDTLSLFTNTQLLQKENVKVPSNWSDFITAARALTVKDDKGKIKVAGAAIGTYDNITHAPDVISLLFAQNGVNQTDISSTSKNATDALSFYTSFVTESGNVWDDTQDASSVAFAKGNLAMYFGYSWDIFALQAMNPSLQFAISPVPHLPGRDMTIASYWVEGVSAKSSHQKEAMLFLHFLTQKDTLQKLYAEEAKVRPFGEIYARSDLAESLTTNPLLAPFVSQAKQAVSGIFYSDTQNDVLNGQLNQYLQRAVGDMLQDTSAETAVGNLSQGVSQIMSQYANNPTSNN